MGNNRDQLSVGELILDLYERAQVRETQILLALAWFSRFDTPLCRVHA